ncbi:hypothetical protein GQ600_26477 [Phytophthora cactorum]|nr:hypothetical protein GQ600_26477 [Phytophthora cactorum]
MSPRRYADHDAVGCRQRSTRWLHIAGCLLKWMLTPGKYERLHGDQRSKAILSILAALKGNGIQHRTKSSIRSKVRAIENQYLSAKQWLEERTSAATTLAPAGYLNAMPSLTNADEVMDDNKVKSPRSKAKRKMRKEVQGPSKRRLTTSAEAEPYSGIHEDEKKIVLK